MEVVSNRLIPDVKTIVAGVGICGCIVAQRLSESAGGKFLEKRVGVVGNERFEINVATQLTTLNF